MFHNPTLSRPHHLASVLSLLLMPCAVLLMLCAVTARAQTSAFTYQGRLTDGGLSPNGTYEMEFKLYDALTEGTAQPQPAPVTIGLTAANGNVVQVTNGVFTVQLDFGSEAFPGATRYLDIAVRHVGDTSFTLLSPRQQVTSTPHAIRSTSAATAMSLSLRIG